MSLVVSPELAFHAYGKRVLHLPSLPEIILKYQKLWAAIVKVHPEDPGRDAIVDHMDTAIRIAEQCTLKGEMVGETWVPRNPQ